MKNQGGHQSGLTSAPAYETGNQQQNVVPMKGKTVQGMVPGGIDMKHQLPPHPSSSTLHK